jgi:hypothetical protein
VIVLLLFALAVAQTGAQPAARDAQQQPPAAGGTMRGRITDRETGQRLPRFRVSISRQPLRSENVRPIDTAVTDTTGAYELTNVQAGLYLVTARPPEYVATHLAQIHGFEEPMLLALRPFAPIPTYGPARSSTSILRCSAASRSPTYSGSCAAGQSAVAARGSNAPLCRKQVVPGRTLVL